MKRLKLVGLALVAVFAVGAFAAGSALAEQGFLVGGMTPTLANLLGGKTVLETPGKRKIECKELKETHIEFANNKHAKGTNRWSGCLFEALFEIVSLGDRNAEILAPVLYLICLDPKNAKGELLREWGVAGEVTNLHLEVPALGVLIELTGTALGTIPTIGQAQLFVVDFTGAKGEQEALECEGKKQKLIFEENHKNAESTSENIVGGLFHFPAFAELMAK